MKKLSTVLCSLFSVLCFATTPTANDLRSYYQDGQVCLCIQFATPVCNDIVWAGTYNGWNTNPNDMVHFQPLAGFSGWYIAAFSDGSDNKQGKAVQLRSDGSFDWQYQTGTLATWSVLSGSTQFAVNEHNEAQMEQISTASPIIATSSAWKNNPCPAPAYSGTLPVLYINTQNGQAVTSKETYLTATYWLDNLGLSGYMAIASAAQPDTMQIKGRGNWTWTGFEKKPYRLKLAKKQALCGLKKNKHFGLLACADDQYSWIKNTMGYLLSEQMGLEWTPGQAPVEVVLNGDYIGLYMLTELIRVDKDRVNIVEQEDGCTNADSVAGGWLVEIDNYAEPYRAELTEPSNQWHGSQIIWVTPKTPEILSTQQQNYLQTQMAAINTALYANDSAAIVGLLDIDEAARFYVVQELMSDCESYHGSCYLHKQMGQGEKWKFGPVWDFGNSFNDRNQYIYDNAYFSQIWIGQLALQPVFQHAVERIWKHWLYYEADSVAGAIDAFAAQITAAAQKDAARWPQYNHADVSNNKSTFMNMYSNHKSWLTYQWGEGQADTTTGVESQKSKVESQKLLREGQIIILRDGVAYDLTGRRL